MKKNSPKVYESISFILDKEKHPIAFQNRVNSFLKSGVNSINAENYASEPIEIELYYDENTGLFFVEANAVDSITIYNPYTGEELEEGDE